MIDYKFNEDLVIAELKEYVESTYSQHYTNAHNNVQALDVYQARGTLTNTAIDNSIKYLMRYGKKDGLNQKDLLKAVHYLVIAMGNELDTKAKPLDYEPEIADARVYADVETYFGLWVAFTDGTQRRIDLSSALGEDMNAHLRTDLFTVAFSYSPLVVQWDDYWLDYTADELYDMGALCDYAPR